MAWLTTPLRWAVACACLATLLVSCELFVVGSKSSRRVPIERSQRSSAGVVHLFKAELDSNNTAAATELILSSTGRPLLAIERYELADDIVRWRGVMRDKEITETTVDTTSAATHNVTITVDYTRKLVFSTIRVESAWWITRIVDATKQR